MFYFGEKQLNVDGHGGEVLLYFFCWSSAVPGGAEFLPARGSEDTAAEGASLPSQVHLQPDCSLSAGWSLLPYLLRHENITEHGTTLMLNIWFSSSVSWI